MLPLTKTGSREKENKTAIRSHELGITRMDLKISITINKNTMYIVFSFFENPPLYCDFFSFFPFFLFFFSLPLCYVILSVYYNSEGVCNVYVCTCVGGRGGVGKVRILGKTFFLILIIYKMIIL